MIIYDFAYWLHIVSYLVWLIAFAVSIWYGIKVRVEEDAVIKRKLMRSERLATSIGAHIGALGILISGAVMASWGPYNWGWFSVQLYPWLALKQILFIVILVLVAFSIKRSVVFKKKLTQEEVPDNETLKSWWSAYRMSLAVYILVVVNTVLGLMKPGLS